jgi:hypothetical protein
VVTVGNKDPYLGFDDTPVADAGIDSSACDFWDALPY